MKIPFVDFNERELNKLRPFVARTNEREAETKAFSDAALRGKTEDLRKRHADGEALDDLLPEAFACVREAARRTLGQRHYDVQLLGGVALHRGTIVEMRTGEGKTLAATAPAYLNALPGRGAHIVTVNDYLAKRDTAWMGQIYDALGMTVGCVTQQGSYVYDAEHKHEEIQNPKSKIQNTDEHDEERDTKGSFEVVEDFLRPAAKKEAYACDITYGTNNEFGFDYLRDNMALSLEQVAQLGRRSPDEGGREHCFAIVDEVDSILIDEARTPLIISAPDADAPKYYETFSRLVPRLKENEDYNLDEKRRAALVTEEGVRKVEQWLGIENLYEEGLRLVHYLEQALRAQTLYQRDRDYVVRDGEVIIVDEFTGRLMPGRRWSDGLHQAVEAKEGVAVQAESRTLATITFQNYFRMYEKLSGMTGTAATSAEEFHKVYGLEVVVVPTDKPMIRVDHADQIFRTQEGKWKALIAAVRERHARGQPMLIGTTSIAKNEFVSAMLEREGIPHELLNAKHHEREGAIIAQTGRKSAVTVATNMAGRGVDIILGGNPPSAAEAEQVRGVGGLCVLGTERHEARRIDNQLRGRAGRQGDSGSSMFFLSLEDDLLRVFGGDKMKGLMARLDIPEEQPIESRMVSRAVESAQSRIEGQNFDIRKHLLDYDDVANRHREAIYRRRRAILEGKDLHEKLIEFLREEVEALAMVHLGSDYPNEWNVEEFTENLKALLPCPHDAHAQLLAIADRGEPAGLLAGSEVVTLETLQDAAGRRRAVVAWAEIVFARAREERRKDLGDETLFMLEQQVLLRSIDALWVEHLETMEALRDSVRLRAFGQRDPVVEYKTEARKTFRQLEAAIRSRAIQMFFRAQVHRHSERPQQNLQYQKPEVGSAVQHASGQGVTPPPQGAVSSTFGSSQPSGTRPQGLAKAKVGRNEPCPCGSGKKYKKCGMVNAPHHKA